MWPAKTAPGMTVTADRMPASQSFLPVQWSSVASADHFTAPVCGSRAYRPGCGGSEGVVLSWICMSDTGT